MVDMKQAFTVSLYGKTLSVEPVKKGSSYFFMIVFPDGTARLAITRATRDDQSKFWTSVPEGRQQEAERIGPLIVGYYLAMQKVENAVTT